jgi:uncharacterized protein (TIGR00251 family)
MEQITGQSKQGVTLAVHVVPRSARNEIAGIHGGALRIRLNAPPVQRAANAALIALVAKTLGVPQRQVEIISGHNSRRKVLAVSGLSKETVERRLAESLA